MVPKFVIWEAWCLHFGTLGGYFSSFGAPWATLGAAGRTRGIQGCILIDFGMILFWQLFGHRGLEIWCCFRVRFHVPFESDF